MAVISESQCNMQDPCVLVIMMISTHCVLLISYQSLELLNIFDKNPMIDSDLKVGTFVNLIANPLLLTTYGEKWHQSLL